MKRVATPELLDTDSGTPAEIAASLFDLRQINRRFGGIATTETLIAAVAGRLGTNKLSLLEVAAGSGYVARSVRQRMQGRGVTLDITLLDRAPSHLNHGSGDENRENGTRTVVADALALPFGNQSFDLVGCCLFAHHLSGEQMVQFVNESLRVCWTGVVINDLVRHPLHLALTYAGMPLFHSRITRHDAVASVRQAYTTEEMLATVRRSGAASVELRRHYLFRMGVIAWKCS